MFFNAEIKIFRGKIVVLETEQNLKGLYPQESQEDRSHEVSWKTVQRCRQHVQQEKLPWVHSLPEKQTRLLCPLSSQSCLRRKFIFLY